MAITLISDMIGVYGIVRKGRAAETDNYHAGSGAPEDTGVSAADREKY